MAKQPLFDTEQDDVPASEPRLRKVPGKVTDDNLRIITDAISLKRATLSHLGERITDGEALTMIADEWLAAESARLSGKGGAT